MVFDALRDMIREILAENNKNSDMEMSLNTSLRKDLNFDSLDLAVLTVRIEDQFDTDIFEDGLIDTLSEIVDKLSKG